MSNITSYVLEQEELEKDFPKPIEQESLPPDYQAYLDQAHLDGEQEMSEEDKDKIAECF